MGYKVHYNPSTGKVAYTADTGKVQVGNGVGSDCIQCTGNTPKYIKVTFSDIEYMSKDVCMNCDNYYDSKMLDDYDPNKSFILKQSTTNPCLWVYKQDLIVTRNKYVSDDGTCQGVVTPHSSSSLELSFTKNSGGGFLLMRLRRATGDVFGYYYYSNAGLFSGINCVDSTHTNELVPAFYSLGCNSTINGYFGQNGTAKVEEL